MLTEALHSGSLAAVAGHIECLPFPDGAFERAIIVDAYHHVVDQATTLGELWRVLAPGGRLVVEEPDIRSASVRLIALGEKLLLMRSHFEAGEVIASRLESLGARATLFSDRHTVWVVADKA
jgi:ubiquinone/menaquinone biosynthesis C-methylase UbiE